MYCPLECDEKTLSLLAQAEQSALAFYAKPQADTQLGLESSTRALLDIDLKPRAARRVAASGSVVGRECFDSPGVNSTEIKRGRRDLF